MSIQEALKVGDIHRKPNKESLNLYIGNGRCGVRLDAYGLMGQEGWVPGRGRTAIMHADHWHRGKYAQDIWLPVARLAWSEADLEPALMDIHQQSLMLHDGTTITNLETRLGSMTIKASFHPEFRDYMLYEIHHEGVGEGAFPALKFIPETLVETYHEQRLEGTLRDAQLSEDEKQWHGVLSMGTANTVIAVRVLSEEGVMKMKSDSTAPEIRANGLRGKHLLIIGIAAEARKEEMLRGLQGFGTDAMQHTREAWHRRWGNAYISVPDPQAQAMWARSLFYVLASYAPDSRCPAAPMGWSGSGWPLSFPQDLSYIHPALLRLGHLDIARSWVEFYASRCEEMRLLSGEIFHAEGTVWAWEFPIGTATNYLREGSPNWYQYQLHNSAYPARMAYETAQYTGDATWALEHAWPVVYGSAQFYRSIVHKEAGDEAWSIHWTPSMGQDELGGENAKNYLCALYSAQYSFQTAIRLADQLRLHPAEYEQWKSILKDGLAFAKLYDAELGIYTTYEGREARQFGEQKHPVQLNPLTFLPLGALDTATETAYHRRAELCYGAGNSFYYGWTLADYLLAASHMGDEEGLLASLEEFIPANYTDSEWIQLYESSNLLDAAFYVTSHGLYLQALNDAVVCDYWGDLKIGHASPAAWEQIQFEGLRTMDGKIWSGLKVEGEWKVTEGGLANVKNEA
ncbi:hypothetical protein SY83_12115 [Paenibacillus swuensis]|uniref:Glycoside hydrolase family 65 central catalytic domain-containing protein n=1 Tax=Paenibacillus swuensis TaxID=1178515 RepID=A0A172TIN7_9BACL|nr:hypothetical protein [Paenibacillus swuensis]ANE46898.1 hypothetical protein SY83_12115 [Paenibacillus swuensis]